MRCTELLLRRYHAAIVLMLKLLSLQQSFSIKAESVSLARRNPFPARHCLPSDSIDVPLAALLNLEVHLIRTRWASSSEQCVDVHHSVDITALHARIHFPSIAYTAHEHCPPLLRSVSSREPSLGSTPSNQALQFSLQCLNLPALLLLDLYALQLQP